MDVHGLALGLPVYWILEYQNLDFCWETAQDIQKKC
jgi:hypothetical protein